MVNVARLNYSLLTLLLLLFSALPAVGDETPIPSLSVAPPLVAQTCFACHGPGGDSSEGAIPTIAGLPESYLLQVMRDYRYGGRFSTLMGQLVQGYTDDQLRLVADYFSQQPFIASKQRVDWDLASKGRQLNRIYCRRCHGDRDQIPEKGVPGLNGRWMSYLRWTLQDYLLGVSQGDEEMSEQLSLLIRRHGEMGLEALIHYYGSAGPKP
jgi:cytochrome subunit of sulfide dehydrogenase